MGRWGDFKKLVTGGGAVAHDDSFGGTAKHRTTSDHAPAHHEYNDACEGRGSSSPIDVIKVKAAQAATAAPVKTSAWTHSLDIIDTPRPGFAGNLNVLEYEALCRARERYLRPPSDWQDSTASFRIAFVDSEDPTSLPASYAEREYETFKVILPSDLHLDPSGENLTKSAGATPTEGKSRKSHAAKDARAEKGEGPHIPSTEPLVLDEPISELDCHLLRFLRARNFDLPETFKMIDSYLLWRSRARVDTICKTVRFPWVMALRAAHPHGYHGVDRLGRPIYIDRVGKSNISAALKVAPLEHLCAYWTQQYEYLRRVILPACSIAAGRRIEQGVSIVDLNGLNLSHLGKKARRVMMHLASLGQNSFPELLGCMVVVNAPVIFGPLWSLVKLLIDESSVSKITVFTRGTSEWKTKLQKLVAPDQLPDFLGGTAPSTSWTSNSFGPWRDAKILEKVQERFPNTPSSFLHLDLNDGSLESLELLRGIPLEDAAASTSAHSTAPLSPKSASPGPPEPSPSHDTDLQNGVENGVTPSEGAKAVDELGGVEEDRDEKEGEKSTNPERSD